MNLTNTKNQEGLTLTVIGQITNLSYHGVEVLQKGNGILGQMINPIINGKVSTNQPKLITTASSMVKFIPMMLVDKKQDFYQSLSYTRAWYIASNVEINEKARDFHRNLNQLKEGILGDKDHAYLDSTELKKLQDEMKPYNVGKVVKIKLQARLFSQKELPGLRKCAKGGFSNVRVLYTFYVPYKEGQDLQALVDAIAKEFRDGGHNEGIVHQSYKVLVDRDKETDQINFTPLKPKTQVKLGDGTTPQDIEEIKGSSWSNNSNRSGGFRKSGVFGK